MNLVISGGWSYGNIGDEVIAKSTIELFNKSFPNSKIKYTSYCLDDFKKQHQIAAIDSVHKIIENKVKKIDDFKDIIDNLQKFNLNNYSDNFDENTLFIMSGGGYFSESWISQFVARLIEIHIAKNKGAKIAIIGQSIGPVYSSLGKKLLIEMFNLCDYISVRDLSTKNFLESLNLNVEVKCHPDLAITISDYTKKSDNEDYINIMPAAYSSYRGIDCKKRYKIIEKIRKRLTFSGINYKIQWVKIVKRISSKHKIKFVMSVNWKWDKDFVEYLIKKAKLQDYELVFCENAEDMCQHLSMGKMIISTKMHPIIVSISYNIPAIAISYDFKVDNFMNLINKDEMCFKNNEINSKKIVNLLEENLDDNKKKELDCTYLKKQVYSMIEEIKDKFEKKES